MKKPETTTVDCLLPDPSNRRKHSDRNLQAIEASLREVGAARSIVIDETDTVLCGNGVLASAPGAGISRVRIVEADGDELIAVRRRGLTEEAKRRLALHDNFAGTLAEWDIDQLTRDLEAGLSFDGLWSSEELDALLGSLGNGTGAGEGDGLPGAEPRVTLAERFGVPPFSVLDARQGYWQDRKRAWLSLGIQSELGRGENSVPNGSDNGLLGESEQARTHYRDASPGGSPDAATRLGADGKTVRGDGKGRGLARSNGQDLMRGEHVVGETHPPEEGWVKTGLTFAAGSPRPDEVSLKLQNMSRGGLTWTGKAAELDGYRVENGEREETATSGTSIFDPVLCELAYRWFCPEGGMVLDPFAGGSVRGIVAAKLGRQYLGVDLSGRQLEANEAQAERICDTVRPAWKTGDSRDLGKIAAGEYDFVFSCPPYADLEVYSDDPADLSTMEYAAFLEAYRGIIAQAVGMLKENRFACFVVGDVRGPKGFYRNFVSDTIAAFQDAGATLYNEAILVTAVGSLPIRVGKQFGAYRKLGKTHQNVIVCYKGDPRRIPDIAGDCEFGELLPDEPED